MLGIDPARLGGRVKVPDPPVVWPDMVDAFALFTSMATQWRWISAGMAGSFQSGLDYAALDATARAIGVQLTPHVFSDVRTLESEALKVWSKRRK